MNAVDAMLAETLRQTKSTKQALNSTNKPGKEEPGKGRVKSDHSRMVTRSIEDRWSSARNVGFVCPRDIGRATEEMKNNARTKPKLKDCYCFPEEACK